MGTGSILACIDLTMHSESVLDRAFELARQDADEIVVLHVVEEDEAVDRILPDDEAVRAIRKAALDDARTRAEAVVRARKPGASGWRVEVAAGPPAKCIVERARELEAGLVVVGANRRRSFRDRLIGSTADRVVRTSPAPVLVAKRPASGSYGRIVGAVDFSPSSEAAALTARRLAPRAAIQLVHVTRIPIQFEAALLQSSAGTAQFEAIRGSMRKQALRRLRMLAGRMEKTQPKPRVRVLWGEPAETLVRLTWNPKVDLVSAGPCGHGVVVETLLGGVAQSLLRDAACDVLIDPRPASEENAR